MDLRLSLDLEIKKVKNGRVGTLFLNIKFKDFKVHISHLSRTPFRAKKSLESVFFSSSTT